MSLPARVGVAAAIVLAPLAAAFPASATTGISYAGLTSDTYMGQVTIDVPPAPPTWSEAAPSGAAYLYDWIMDYQPSTNLYAQIGFIVGRDGCYRVAVYESDGFYDADYGPCLTPGSAHTFAVTIREDGQAAAVDLRADGVLDASYPLPAGGGAFGWQVQVQAEGAGTFHTPATRFYNVENLSADHGLNENGCLRTYDANLPASWIVEPAC